MSRQYEVWGRKDTETAARVLKGGITKRGDAVLYEQRRRDEGFIDTVIREGTKSGDPVETGRSMRRR